MKKIIFILLLLVANNSFSFTLIPNNHSEFPCLSEDFLSEISEKLIINFSDIPNPFNKTLLKSNFLFY